jgi:hypothetical protein
LCNVHRPGDGLVGSDKDGAPDQVDDVPMTRPDTQKIAAGGRDAAPPYAQLHRALERQLTWITEFSAVGDLLSAQDARMAADAIWDELSSD